MDIYLASNEKSQDRIKVISVEGVRKAFGSVIALDGVDLSVAGGRVLALLGPNGAGKTTLIRILTTLLIPDFGTAEIYGFDVIKEAESVRKIIGLAGQSVALDDNLKGRENLELVARLYHLPWRRVSEKAQELLIRFGLSDASERLVKTYSGGMRKRLDLAASLIGEPKVIFLDEPTTGLDPKSRFELWEVIRLLAKEGATIFLTTQYLEEADHLADDIVIIDRGKVIARGTPNELKGISRDILEIELVDFSFLKEALQIVSRIGSENPTHETSSGKIFLPVENPTQSLLAIVRNLDREKIAISNISLRRPSLDEVFLNLTARPRKN